MLEVFRFRRNSEVQKAPSSPKVIYHSSLKNKDFTVSVDGKRCGDLLRASGVSEKKIKKLKIKVTAKPIMAPDGTERPGETYGNKVKLSTAASIINEKPPFDKVNEKLNHTIIHELGHVVSLSQQTEPSGLYFYSNPQALHNYVQAEELKAETFRVIVEKSNLWNELYKIAPKNTD